ncbi:MAG: SusC/RagA family TonB-linked outer membrane protein [Bacteroidales bacterium]|nr:SusC/RagA family TonB-linked outer membrane protein [Bacteroidales bacterium]
MKKLIILFLLLTPLIHALGQQRTIQGVVTASDTETPLPGATVLIQGTTVGTVTDIEGRFSTQASTGDVLLISFVGYTSVEHTVGQSNDLEIVLDPDVGQLEEVVVVGYGVEKKSLVTGAIAKVSNEEIEKTNTLRIEQALQGKTAGVSITQLSGQPGSGFTIRVRGTGSNGNSEPIFIVDGLRMGGIENINVNDIESVEVLKDAASAAIYGAEGGNGVVLITTKSGTATEPRLTYKYYYGVQNVANSDFSVMNSRDYLDYRWRALLAEGKDSATINNMIPLSGNETYSTNWLEEVINPAPMSEHFLSYSGGNEKSQYNASASYLNQDGIGGGEKANFTRLTARFSGDHQVKKWIKIGHKLNYSHSERRSLPENSTFNSFMNMSILLDPLTPTTVPYDSMYFVGEDFRPNLVNDGEGNYYGISRIVSGEIYNPLALLEIQHGQSNSDKLFGSIYADLTPFKGLSYRTKLDFDLAYVNYNGWSQKRYLNSEQDFDTNGTYRGYNKYQTYQWGNFINYDLTAGDHNIRFLAGTEANVYKNINLSASGSNMIKESDSFAYVGTTPDSTHIAGDWYNEIRRFSYIGRISYNFREKYMATINFRTDYSTLFGTNYRAGYFPSASAGWVISREDFFNIQPVSFMKIRASWGQNGSTSNLGSFGYLSLITGVYQYTNSANQLERGSEPRAISNPSLRWEKSEQTDIGLDIGFVNNKLYLTADIYNKVTKDLITQSTWATLYGNYNSSINAGNIVNRGVEMELSWKDNFGFFNYNVSLNAAYNYNEVTNTGEQDKLYGATVFTDDDNLTFFEEGYPAWYFSAYKTDGIFQTIEEIDNYTGLDGRKIQPNAVPGDVKFVDVNKDGVIDPDDRVMVGDPYPDWVMGANLFAEYKGFDITMYVQSALGLNVVNALNRSDRLGMNKPQFYYDMAWDGEDSTNEWFRPTEIDPNGNFRMSDLLVEDADFLRIKTLQIGYNFGEMNLFNDFGFKEARVYVSGTNLFTLTNYKGLEPEIGAVGGPSGIGIDYGFYPSARIYQFGFRVTF